jgi:Zn-dependent protease with chaperone function
MKPAFAPARPVPAQQTQAVTPFPELVFATNPVDPKKLLSKGTGFYSTLGWLMLIAWACILTAATMGVGLLMLLVSPIVEAFRWKKVRALIRGQGVQVSSDQFPELHRTVEAFARRLGMKEVPEVYVVEDSMQNGFAVKLGTKDIIMLTDDVISGALRSGDPRALGFVVGHELAHVALGHTKTLRGIMRTVFKALSRADELTADNVATALIGDARVAVKGITLLTVGPQLMPHLNPAALERQAREVVADKNSKKAEKRLSHPLLLRRIHNVLSQRSN